MEVIVVADAQELGCVVADGVAALLKRTEQPTIGLATGSSPQPIYDELIRRCDQGLLSFATVTACLLDEYIGLRPGHPQLYRAFIRRVLVDRIDLATECLLTPEVVNSNLPEACEQYEARLREEGGVDLQILGIGSDGHIGFNEPSSSLASRTRVKTLMLRTRQDNARFFDDDLEQVPKHAITQGIGTILEARHLILVAQGKAKAGSIAQAIEGPLTSFVPASALQMHPHVTIVLDEAAASELKLIDYYRAAYRDKPDWQGI